MNFKPSFGRFVRVTGLLVALALAWISMNARGADFAAGTSIDLGGLKITVRKFETLPVVSDEYTRRFKFDSFENPKLEQLRKRYGLDKVIAPGRDEYEKQLHLLDWTHRQFKKFGTPSTNCVGALAILEGIEQGHTFFCSHYIQVMVSGAASLGWVNRPLALRRHQGANKAGGSTEHSVTEMWSNQHRKWVMFDPTSNMVIETNGVPLNAWEIRHEWFYRNGTNLTFVIGKGQRRYRKANLPIVLGRFPDFGNLTVEPDELDKYGFIGYIPNTDLMDSGFDYAKMFITKDALCEGTQWHVRPLPKDPAIDPYFPIHQANVRIDIKNTTLRVTLNTFTPSFERYELRIDRGGWSETEPNFTWEPHPGHNRLEARVLNRFGIKGPTSSVELDVVE